MVNGLERIRCKIYLPGRESIKSKKPDTGGTNTNDKSIKCQQLSEKHCLEKQNDACKVENL